VIVAEGHHFSDNFVNSRQGWSFLDQHPLEHIERGERPFDLNGRTRAVIQHEPT
jgi:hypothetical protein